jgi:hypothetical protein
MKYNEGELIKLVESTNASMNQLIHIKISYQTVSPESAKEGDTSDQGWEDEEGENFESPEEAVYWLDKKGVAEASSSQFHPGIWYSSSPDVDYGTGEETIYSFHITASPQDQQMIYKILKNKRRI